MTRLLVFCNTRPDKRIQFKKFPASRRTNFSTTSCDSSLQQFVSSLKIVSSFGNFWSSWDFSHWDSLEFKTKRKSKSGGDLEVEKWTDNLQQVMAEVLYLCCIIWALSIHLAVIAASTAHLQRIHNSVLL